MFRRKCLDEDELGAILKAEVEKDWFTYRGVMAVRAIGLLKLPAHIQVLADLLDRDDDVLIEELSEALIHYQTDEVVDPVKPYAMQDETCIYALSVLQNTKTDYAQSAMVECYEVLDEDGKGMVIEGLSHQLSEKAFPLIDDYLFHEYRYGVSDMDQVLYSFYKIMGRSHEDSELWRVSWERSEQNRSDYERSGGIFKKAEPMSVTKVVRNDPCLCGSGKKYKKCCGK
ncbi:SEC-C domain-containing protein [Sporosarcina sp. Marseille-Q4063]|uniref:SEC-C metal-binding domain-containing protein n=1 Tax=Sporosarcina sp. Marseille-Q4063 TaxID=2810514 RepID=UPI001BB09D47|nr:SEC-C metal-binding domain-containing protein [Sporosarcina sp. Marseille-Q4063]QUW22955.1 SEC-C domain-containing protein [Sporosarcina sp. Marseille-Q4063]